MQLSELLANISSLTSAVFLIESTLGDFINHFFFQNDLINALYNFEKGNANKLLKLTIKYSLNSCNQLRNTEIKNIFKKEPHFCGNLKESNMHIIVEDEKDRSNVGFADDQQHQQMKKNNYINNKDNPISNTNISNNNSHNNSNINNQDEQQDSTKRENMNINTDNKTSKTIVIEKLNDSKSNKPLFNRKYNINNFKNDDTTSNINKINIHNKKQI